MDSEHVIFERKQVIDWLCEQYVNKNNWAMLYGYRRRLETFTNADLMAIRSIVEKERDKNSGHFS